MSNISVIFNVIFIFYDSTVKANNKAELYIELTYTLIFRGKLHKVLCTGLAQVFKIWSPGRIAGVAVTGVTDKSSARAKKILPAGCILCILFTDSCGSGKATKILRKAKGKARSGVSFSHQSGTCK